MASKSGCAQGPRCDVDETVMTPAPARLSSRTGYRRCMGATPAGRRTSSVLVAIFLSSMAMAVTVSPAQAVTCAPDGTLPSNGDAGTVRLADDFETGNLRRWSKVVREGDASVSVQNAKFHDGHCALRLWVTTRSDSRANVRKYLATDTRTIRASGWFRVDRQGVTGSNVPIFRFFDGDRRMVDVHRRNGSGDLWLRTSDGRGGWTYVRLGKYMPLGKWMYFKFRVTADWSSSVVSVSVNGTYLYWRQGHRVPTSRVNMVMVGAEHVKQQMDLYIDEIVIKTP